MAKIATTNVKRNAGTGFRTTPLASAEKWEVEELAYQFFVERGYEHGHDQEDWLRAEAIVRNKRS